MYFKLIVGLKKKENGIKYHYVLYFNDHIIIPMMFIKCNRYTIIKI